MKKVVVGLFAVGAVIALRAAAGRSGQRMREHGKQMAARCKDMMASQPGEHGKAAGLHEHCKEMAAHKSHREAHETRERSEQEAPQFEANGETVAV